MQTAHCRTSSCSTPCISSRLGSASSIQLGLSPCRAGIRRWQQHCSSICHRVIAFSGASGQQPACSQAAAGSSMADPSAGENRAAEVEPATVPVGRVDAAAVGNLDGAPAVGLSCSMPPETELASSMQLTHSSVHTKLAVVDMAAFTEALQASSNPDSGSSPSGMAVRAASGYCLPDMARIPSHCRAAYQHALTVLEEAAHQLQRGQVVAVPTETVYGLAADACNPAAVGRIFEAKGRPQDNPLIVHISDLVMLEQLYPGRSLQDVLPPLYWPLIADLWPGPLTLLLPTSPVLAPGVSAGQATVAVRMPSHPLARALIHTAGVPLAAPSANISGRPSPTTAAHVMADLSGRIPLVVDGGPAGVGLESTVLDGLRDPPAVLRPGGVTREVLALYPGLSQCGVYAVTFTDPELEARPTTPGMKYRHYSPTTPLVLLDPACTSEPWPTTGWVQWVDTQVKLQQQARGLDGKIVVLRTSLLPSTLCGWVGDKPCKRTMPPSATSAEPSGKCGAVYTYNLGSTTEEVGQNLFAAMREVDECDVVVMVVEGCGAAGAGLAVMNRLRKAASSVVSMV